jgi:3-hydroxyacyl-CoA dehydrogenase
MVDAGTLGTKSGKGFYNHPPHAPIAEKDHIVFLDIIKGELRSLAIDGREGKTLVTGLTRRPDGVQIDERPGKGRYRPS